LGVSLLAMGVGGVANLTIVMEMGRLASVVFGLLLGLHALFFVLKRKKRVVEEPRRGCCD